jgi:bifunctional UDP-N-acetylglucosamine pyrophosphorylase / glucosamine-1-phosphate N-acetyltransferase
MKPLAVIILAAGLGKRMLSDVPKVAIKTRVCSLIEHVLRSVAPMKPEQVMVVTGHKRELVEKTVTDGRCSGTYEDLPIGFAFQDKQLGTAHATQCGLDKLESFVGDVLILAGDVPLIETTTLRRLVEVHRNDHAALTLLTVRVSEENSYGRVVRGRQGVERIVEARDCSEEELLIEEINSGIYVVDSKFLSESLKLIRNENAQKEFYLTDIVGIASSQGYRVAALTVRDELEVQGVNNREELLVVDRALRRRKISKLIASGVFVEDPDSLFLDEAVEIAPGATVGPMVQLIGSTVIEAGVVLEGNCRIVDSRIGANSRIRFGVSIEGATIESECAVGPFAHIRPGTHLEQEVRIGNFVETKAAHLMQGAKANHLSYLGDCRVGEKTNIGAGTITCNYDGYNKFKTEIGRGVFIGSNSSLVAPVTIGDGSVIAAGSVITKNVEADALAIARAPQVAKPGWADSRRRSKKEAI